jgi:ferrochelatase
MSRRAIILLNMGGANNPDEVKLFLRNMFNDPLILKAPSFVRKLVANLIIWRRAENSKNNLLQIGDKSPIVTYTKKLLKKLNRSARFEAIMRYTPPFSKDVLIKLRNDKIEELILLPMYPQYSTTTTLSSFRDIFDSLAEMHWSELSIRTVKPYYLDDRFLKIITESIYSVIPDPENWNLIFSAHSLPQKIIDNGDPYLSQIETQVKTLKNMLNNFKSIHLAFQSKIGPLKWLEPSLNIKLSEFKGEKVVIYPISFTVDNLETDFELNIEYRHIAKDFGISDYLVVKAPNDSEDFVKFLIELANGN